MLNLIHSNLYQLAHGKMVYVAFVLLVAYFGLTAYSNFQSSQPEGIAQMEQDLAQLKQEDAEPESIVQMEQTIHAFKTHTFDGGYTDADLVGIAPGGLLSAILCVLTALLCYQDFSAGFAKSQLSALVGHQMSGAHSPAGRGSYYAAKLATIAIMDAVFLTITVTLAIASNAILGFTVSDPEPAWQVAAWTLLTWLFLCGYTFAAAAITWAERNQAVGVVGALLLGSQALEGIMQLALSSGVQLFPGTVIAAALDVIAAWLPTVSTNILLGGTPALFSTANGGLWEAAAQALSLTAHPLTHVIVTALGFLALGLVVVFLGCRRRDVA